MKNIRIALSFVKKNIVPIVLIMLMMMVTIFLLISIYGEYRYITYTRDIIENSGLKNAVYFSHSIGHGNDYSPDKIKDFQNKLKNYSAVKNIINTVSAAVNYKPLNYSPAVVVYDQFMIENLKQPLKDGKWFSSETDPSKYEYPEIIIGGKYWNSVKSGDIIELEIYDQICKVEVIGTLGEPAFFPQFSTFGTSTGANELFKASPYVLYLNKNSFNIDLSTSFLNYTFFVNIKESASEAEKQELLDYLIQHGSYFTYEQLIEHTNAEIKELMQESFPFPLFLIAIATISMICVSAVAIQRSMREQSVYYLIGCSKKRSIAIMTITLLLFFGLPSLINIIGSIFFPNFLRADERRYAIEYIIDAGCIMPVIVYFVFIAVVLTLLPIIIYRKHSPLTFYRRNL